MAVGGPQVKVDVYRSVPSFYLHPFSTASDFHDNGHFHPSYQNLKKTYTHTHPWVPLLLLPLDVREIEKSSAAQKVQSVIR